MRYVLLNKPFEVLTQFTDENGRATLKDFVPIPKIYPVGRLDFDSEGLVLLTDDKPLQHRLSEPRFKVPKTYWVQVEGIPTEEAIATLRRGVDIKTSFTAPAEVELLPEPPAIWERPKPIRFRANIPTSWLQITISQGINRQVRKMTAAVGFPTLRLVRVKIAHLEVENLAPGQWRELTAPEAAKLKAAFSATKMPAERQVQSKETKSKSATGSTALSTGAPARKTFKPAPSNFKRPAGSDQSPKGTSDRPKRGPKTSRPR